MTTLDKPSTSFTAYQGEAVSDVQVVNFPQKLSSEASVHHDQQVEAEVSISQTTEGESAAIAVTSWAIVLARWTNLETLSFAISSQGKELSSPTILSFQYDIACNKQLSTIVREAQDVLCHSNESVLAAKTFKDAYKSHRRNVLLLPSRGTYQNVNEAGTNTNTPELLKGVALVVDCRAVLSTGKVTVWFDSKIFSPVLANHLIQHLGSAIDDLGNHREMIAKSLNLTTDADLKRISEWVPQALPPADDRMLYSGFEEHLRSSPASIAIRQTEQIMTYKELDSLASTLSLALLEISPKGIGNVAIVFEKSAYALVAMLGIWKAGGAYVPLDPAAPSSRIETIISDADIQAVLCSMEKYSRLQELDLDCPVIGVNHKYLHRTKKAQKASKTPSYSNDLQIHNTDLAVIIYTSGSTGTPKGVALTHMALTTSIEAWSHHFPLDQNTRTFQYAAFTFDISIADIWMTLGLGGTVCLPTEDERLDILNFVQAEQCSYTCLTTSVIATLPIDIVRNGPLKMINQCGEPVTRAVVKKFAKENLYFMSCYGPSEASVYATYTERFTPESEALDIGRPLGGSVAIVDPNNPHKLAPVGAVGELAIFGHTLANGYFNNPGKTEEAFHTGLKWTSQLASTHQHLGRVYLTNDLVRYTGQGTMIYMGRKGGYIKFNGQRIEPGEIESTILSHTDGDDIAVHVAVYETEKNSTTSQHLTCFFTEAKNRPKDARPRLLDRDALDLEKIMSWTKALRSKLPEYMVPRLFVPVSATPKNASGKTDKTRLVAMLEKVSVEDVMQKYGVESKSVSLNDKPA